MKITIGIIVVIIVIAAGYFLFMNKPVQNPETTGTDTSAPLETLNPAGTVETGNPDAANMGAAGESVTTITYSDTGFSPKSITIPVGSTVKFVNTSTHTMWVASAVHPTHAAYDGTTLQQHCADKSSFDECAAEPAGATYTFTFTKAGTFGYHNHARANDTGSITVQ